jgi:hypothetical protein
MASRFRGALRLDYDLTSRHNRAQEITAGIKQPDYQATSFWSSGVQLCSGHSSNVRRAAILIG